VKEEFMPWLQREFPDLVERYERMYRKPYGPSSDRKELARRVSSISRALGGLGPDPAGPSSRFSRRGSGPTKGDPVPGEPKQLTIV
jgi:hypothetical protein